MADLTIFEKAKALHGKGIFIGPRDPQRNSFYPGAFMVCEDTEAGPSEFAGMGGGYCIVGDDLAFLITEAYYCFVG